MKGIYRRIILSTLLLALPISGIAADVNNMFGVWGSVTLQGDFKAVSPKLEKYNWFIMNQTRTRDDSPKGSRFTENILFAQLGYQLNKHASVWLGYVHEWGDPLNKLSFQESRPYQDFVWKLDFSNAKFISRTRMDERIHLTTGDVGYRPRQLLQISYPLPFLDGLNAYVGDEVLFYINKNQFGKQGFSENRILSGLSYKLTQHMGVDLGYIGQYVDTQPGNNIFTHNLQINIAYKF